MQSFYGAFHCGTSFFSLCSPFAPRSVLLAICLILWIDFTQQISAHLSSCMSFQQNIRVTSVRNNPCILACGDNIPKTSDIGTATANSILDCINTYDGPSGRDVTYFWATSNTYPFGGVNHGNALNLASWRVDLTI